MGNFNAGQFTKQLHLGAFIPEIDEKLHGIPTMHTEAACASGALSVFFGAQWIMGGFHDAVLVVGAEQQKTMSSKDGGDVLGAAADFDVERPEYGDFMFPKLFGRIAQIYVDKYGASPDDLAAVAYKNYAHARLNPLAQMRVSRISPTTTPRRSRRKTRASRRLCAFPIARRSPMARPPIVLVSGKYLEKHGIDKSKFRSSSASATQPITSRSEKKDAPTFTTARKAAEKAFGMANLKPRDMHGAEVHDCFSITEIVAYEILGLAEPGKGAELAKSGATAFPQVRGEHVSGKIDFEIPVNTGGGLIGDGHPVGATGVRQVVDAYQQLTNQADARQIKGAKKFLTFNMGGSLTTSVAMIWGVG